MTLLELGSDIAGSIRAPSHYCGTFGHKPTFGVVPHRGHIPPAPGTVRANDIGVMGPMGRSVADLVLAFDVLTSGDLLGVPGARLPAATQAARSLGDLRIGVWLDDPAVPIDGAVQEVLERALAELASAGATLVDDARPATSLRDSHHVFSELLSGALSAGYPDSVVAFLDEIATGFGPDDPSDAAAMTRGIVGRHRDWILADDRRARIAQEWDAVFERVDVMITPVTSVVAPLHGSEIPMDQRTITVNGTERSCLDQIVWPGLAGVSYLPATAIPAGRSAAGLPVGLQIVGPRFADHTTLRVAARAEEVLGGFVPPPWPAPSS
jgi:amidase